MATQRKLGVDQLFINDHLKLALIRWHQFDLFDHMLIILEQFFRQAHGPTCVMSDRAINDLDDQHDPSANFERLYHSPKIAIGKIVRYSKSLSTNI